MISQDALYEVTRHGDSPNIARLVMVCQFLKVP